MTEIAEYLMTNYYSCYKGTRPDIIPTEEQLEAGIRNFPDKFVVLRNKGKIKGVAVYLSLSDESYAMLQVLDITRVDIIKKLLNEHGPNVHFLLLAADGVVTILRGIREVKNKVRPKTISWWNPSMTKIHRYKGE